MLIRCFEPDDAERVVELWRLVFPEYDDPSKPQRSPRANIARKLATQPELFWVAELAARELIGTAMAGYDGHRGWIYGLGVHPAHRRRGVGRRLLEHAEDALWKLGCPKINLQVLSGNGEARCFYEKLGYAVDDVISYGKRAR